MHWLVRIGIPCLTVFSLLIAPAASAEPVKLRMGSLIPKNSLYHRTLLEMGDVWKKAQNDGSTFTLYTDGSQGSETDVVKRMRIGQLNAALITVVGLHEIEPSVSALQTMPLMFRSWEELDYVREKMRPAMEKKFLDKGYVVLLWGDAGWVRFFSREPARHPDDFKRMKVFTWAGEAEQAQIMRAMGYQPVSLETSDMLPALQTGLISVVPATPYYALTAQFVGPAPYMLDLNWAPIVGALVLTKKTWDAMSPTGRDALRAAALKYGPQMRAKARAEVDEAVAAMQKRGLQVTTLTPEQRAEWHKLAESVYPKIRGTLVPAETFDEVQRLLSDYRAGRAK
jgi:TRAP-type transport system periplasmic protein